jgi:hypothetical protein
MIFLEVTCKNGTKALLNIANITTITQSLLTKENVFVSFAGSVDEYITVEASIEQFGQKIKAAIYHHKIANK